MRMDTCMPKSLHSSPENTTLLIDYTQIQNKKFFLNNICALKTFLLFRYYFIVVAFSDNLKYPSGLSLCPCF